MQTVSTFMGHSIALILGHFYVQFEGDELPFDTIKQAEGFICAQYEKQQEAETL